MRMYYCILLFFYCHLVVAQNAIPPLLIPYRVGNNWGYSDSTGKLLIPAKYQEANPYCYGRGLVKRKGKFGYVDYNGKVALPIQYTQATNFRSERGVIYAKVTYKGKSLLINASGKSISVQFIFPTDYGLNSIICGITRPTKPYSTYHFDTNIDIEKGDSITLNFLQFFYPDNNCILLAKKETGWGAISKENHNLIPFENDTLLLEQYDYYKFKKNSLWGLYHKSGKLLIENKYTSLQVLDDSLILVTIANGKKGYLSFTGKEYFREQ